MTINFVTLRRPIVIWIRNHTTRQDGKNPQAQNWSSSLSFMSNPQRCHKPHVFMKVIKKQGTRLLTNSIGLSPIGCVYDTSD